MKLEKLRLQERETLLSHIGTIKFCCEHLTNYYPRSDKEHWITKLVMSSILEVERKVIQSINRGAYKGSISLTDAQAFALYVQYLHLPIHENEIYQWNLRNQIINSLTIQMQ